jgi:hypothetical protein
MQGGKAVDVSGTKKGSIWNKNINEIESNSKIKIIGSGSQVG